jgi:flavoprotein
MADFQFNLWESIRKRNVSGVADNLLMYGFCGVATIVIPFLIIGRYVKEKFHNAITYDIDICEKCIQKFMTIPSEDYRNYIMSRCKVCSFDSFQFRDAISGGPDRCKRFTSEEYVAWSK